MACNTTSGAGGFAASWWEEHATREIQASTTADTPMRTDLPITGPKLPHHRGNVVFRRPDLPITGPKLPHHRGNVVFRRPDQRDDPSDDAPSQEKVEQEDREEVALAPGQIGR